MHLITASMSTKKDSALAPVMGSSSILEPGSMAIVALNIAPSKEVEPCTNLHMREVSKSPPRPPLRSPQPFPAYLFTQSLTENLLSHPKV